MLLDHFERLYVLNLPYKRDRKQRLTAHLLEQGLARPQDITWVRAICGNHCPPAPWFQAGSGAWGCLQSHRRIVEDSILDEIESYCVLEDDAVFCDRSADLLNGLMGEVPVDWGQIYLGGQHLLPPEPIAPDSAILRCRNVNRTHAFSLNRRAFHSFYQHISNAPDFIRKEPWHLDHQLGLAHERRDWNAYAPLWWLAGQEGGLSNISNSINPRMWWQSATCYKCLPYIFLADEPDLSLAARLDTRVFFGGGLGGSVWQDKGPVEDWETGESFLVRLEVVAREAMELRMLPGIRQAKLTFEEVRNVWPGGVIHAKDADLEHLVDYPFNGLFPHPVTSWLV